MGKSKRNNQEGRLRERINELDEENRKLKRNYKDDLFCLRKNVSYLQNKLNDKDEEMRYMKRTIFNLNESVNDLNNILMDYRNSDIGKLKDEIRRLRVENLIFKKMLNIEEQRHYKPSFLEIIKLLFTR